jgi:RNA polymerase sigma-70 factor (ECF subfamily)
MNTSADNAVPFGHPDSSKIIQRIFIARRSYWITEGSMCEPDDALVERSQKGELEAFEMLITKHQRMIHSLTYRMTGSAADSEDLAQETFVRAYRSIRSYRADCKFSTWLYRIAMNLCLNWRERENTRSATYRHWAAEQESAGHEHREERGSAQLQAALLKLPTKQRAAIMLTMYDGLNHAEAAEVLDCSEATVSWRVFAAKRKLKRLLSKPGESDERF